MLKTIAKLSCLSVLCLAVALPAEAQFECSEDLPKVRHAELVRQVQDNYQQISDLQARFLQKSYFLGMNKFKESFGEVLFKRPGMMDWRYEQPQPQRFVADGKTLWFVQPGENQVTIGKFESAFNTSLPVSFLLGLGSLGENFSVESACKATERRTVLTLQPKKPDPALKQFKLIVEQGTGMPVGAKIIDVGGNETAIVFEHVSTALSLKPEQFVYEIPKGMDIIDQRNTQ